MKLAITVIRNTAKDFVTSLKKESMKASRQAINKCGLLLRNQARKNLKSSNIHITDSRTRKGNKLYNDKLLAGVRTGKTFRKDNSFARYVRITKNKRNKRSGWFRLGWLDKGTKQRTTKKHSTGSMIGAHFYDSALASYQSKFGQEYNNEMNKALTKLK